MCQCQPGTDKVITCMQGLWEGKFEVPNCARKASTKLTAYSLSLEDAQRTQISEEELCSFLWGFHFKPVVGEHWMLLDPYCEGLCIELPAACPCSLLRGPRSCAAACVALLLGWLAESG